MQEATHHVILMHGNHSELSEFEISDRLHAIVDEMLEAYGKRSPRGLSGNMLAPPQPPFDFSRPNEHDSKAEFQYELNAVEESIEHLRLTVQLLAPKKDVPEQSDMFARLRPIVDQKMRNEAMRVAIDDARSLVTRNVAQVGGYEISLFVILDLWSSLTERHQELKDQEEKFWNLSHRAPDYYARAIAVRLAKLYAIQTGQKPGYGTAAITGDPSTSYSRALKQVFKVLGIKGGIRTHAEYAVTQITEEDLKPPINSLAQLMNQDRPQYSEGIEKVARTLMDRSTGK